MRTPLVDYLSQSESESEPASDCDVKLEPSDQCALSEWTPPTRTKQPAPTISKTALARINGKIVSVQVAYSKSHHVLAVNGTSPTKALYDASKVGKRGAHLQRLLEEVDVSNSKDLTTVTCRGCMKTINVSRRSSWIDHRFSCFRLQLRLRQELDGDSSMQSYEGSPSPQMDKRKQTTIKLKPKKLVALRVNGKTRNYHYSKNRNKIRLDGKSLSEVFYGTKLKQANRLRWGLIDRDPDVLHYSKTERFCVCRGCGEVINAFSTDFWLEHRLKCLGLQGGKAKESSEQVHTSDLWHYSDDDSDLKLQRTNAELSPFIEDLVRKSPGVRQSTEQAQSNNDPDDDCEAIETLLPIVSASRSSSVA